MTTSAAPLPPVTPTSPVVGRAADVVLSAARLVTGLLFAQHGAQKLFGWFADPAQGGGGGGGGGLPPLMLAAGAIEFFGGLLVALGLFTRPVAFLCSGTMAVAYFMAHATRGFWPIVNKGESAILFCFAFLLFWALGPGRYSVDGLLRRRA